MEKQRERLKAHAAEVELKNKLKEEGRAYFSTGNIKKAMSLPECGFSPSSKVKKILWRPNNYRLKIPIKKGSSGNVQATLLPSLNFQWNFKRRGMAVLRVNERITLICQPNSITGIYSLKDAEGHKQWHAVETEAEGAFIAWLEGKVKDIEQLLRFEIAKHGLPLDYSAAVWIRHEDGIKNEEFLSTLPAELVLHDTYFKKVYREETEFKSPEYVKNYITNRAIERISPEISRELAEIKAQLQPAASNMAPAPPLNMAEARAFLEARELDICQTCGYMRRRCGCKSSAYKTQEQVLNKLFKI